MGEHAGTETQVEKLIGHFESGEISRRSLIKALAGMAVASTTAGTAGAAGIRGPEVLNALLAAPSPPEPDEGRKIVLERILNHTYTRTGNRATLDVPTKGGNITSVLSGANEFIVNTDADHNLTNGDRVKISDVVTSQEINGVWEIRNETNRSFSLVGSSKDGNSYGVGGWEQTYLVFGSDEEHREWLFGEGRWNNDGLKQYENGKNSIKRPHRGHNRNGVDVGGGAGNHAAAMRRTLKETAVAASNEINLFQLGASNTTGYNFDDLYGLVRLKLDYTCHHCKEGEKINTLRGILALSKNLLAATGPGARKKRSLGRAVNKLMDEHWVELMAEINKGGADAKTSAQAVSNADSAMMKTKVFSDEVGTFSSHEGY